MLVIQNSHKVRSTKAALQQALGDVDKAYNDAFDKTQPVKKTADAEETYGF